MSGRTFTLVWIPVMRADIASDAPYAWDGAPETVAVGRYADVARAWRRTHRGYFRGIGGSDDPRSYRTIPGPSSANGRRFALHVIGRGTMAIHEVTP